MEVKSSINLSNSYKIRFAEEKLNFFGKFAGLNFNFQVCKTPEQIISFLHEESIDCAIVDVRNYFDIKLDFLDWFFINMYENCDFDLLISKNSTQMYQKIGVLTNNQWFYCKKRFKLADIVFIKDFKSISELLEDFDLVMLPGYLANEIPGAFDIEKIKIIDLQKPFFEGASCVIFRKDDERFLFLRQFFIKSVYFIGAGVGSKNYATYEAIQTIKNLDVCLFDNLMDHSLLDFLPEHAVLVDVGKRCDHHKLNQSKITDLISMYARMGFRVGRLKGGDPSIFGRLAEEIRVLEDLKINFHIVPGISTINALAIKSGIILTRREINRGFCVLSAIKHKGAIAEFSKNEFDNLPLIFFMGVKAIGKISSSLINEGYLPQTKAALVFNIGTDKEFDIRGTLSDIADKINDLRKQSFFDNPPGIFIVGEIANFYYKKEGLLRNKRILLPNPLDYGLYFNFKDVDATLCTYDLDIQYKIEKNLFENVISFQAIAISQVKIAQALIEALFEYKLDIRLLPQLITDSDYVFNFLRDYGLNCIKSIDSVCGLNMCFIYGHECCNDLAEHLKLNNNMHKIKLESQSFKQKELPAFDMIYFNSIEQYCYFIDLYGLNCLTNKVILVSNNTILKFLLSNKVQSSICLFDEADNFKMSIAGLLKFIKPN